MHLEELDREASGCKKYPVLWIEGEASRDSSRRIWDEEDAVVTTKHMFLADSVT